MKTLKVTITFITESLGLSPSDPEVYKNYIATKNPDGPSKDEKIAKEIQAVKNDSETDDPEGEVVKKQMTIFLKDKDGNPVIHDHQIKGFFKDACGALQKMKDEEMAKESAKIKAYKKIIDGDIFVYPEYIPINVAGDKGVCERPLRTSGPSGDRVALAASETVPAGSSATFYVTVPDIYENVVLEWLNYGVFRGFSQWRNAGKGRFLYDVETKKGMPPREVIELKATKI